MTDSTPFTAHCTQCSRPFVRRRHRAVMFCSDACKQGYYRVKRAQDSTQQTVIAAERTARSALDTLLRSGDSGQAALARLAEYASGLTTGNGVRDGSA